VEVGSEGDERTRQERSMAKTCSRSTHTIVSGIRRANNTFGAGRFVGHVLLLDPLSLPG
jgi:hypothetical protein